MIISKTARALQIYRDELAKLRVVLTTPRGSKTARDEQAALREQASQTDRCVYCGATLLIRSSRHLEACVQCGKQLDKMLVIKSQIIRGGEDIWDLQYLRKKYLTMTVVPVAFRGANGRVDEVVEALDRAIEAGQAHKAARRAQVAREAEKNVEEAKRREFTALLVRCGADADSEETKEKVDEMYADWLARTT